MILQSVNDTLNFLRSLPADTSIPLKKHSPRQVHSAKNFGMLNAANFPLPGIKGLYED